MFTEKWNHGLKAMNTTSGGDKDAAPTPTPPRTTSHLTTGVAVGLAASVAERSRRTLGQDENKHCCCACVTKESSPAMSKGNGLSSAPLTLIKARNPLLCIAPNNNKSMKATCSRQGALSVSHARTPVSGCVLSSTSFHTHCIYGRGSL